MMPITDELIVVQKTYLDKLQVKASIMWLGWIMALVLLTVSYCALSRVESLTKQIRDIQNHQTDLEFKLDESRLALVKAWGTHQQEIKTVEAWGEYIKTRDDLSRYNSTQDPLPALTANLGKHK